MQAAGSVITSQADLLWSVALALMLAKFYLVGRFLSGSVTMRFGSISWFMLFTSITMQVLSMFCGYLTYGAIVTMARCTPNKEGIVVKWCIDRTITEASAYSNAEVVALLQFGGFGIGLVLFVILFAMETRAVAKALNSE